MSNSTFIPYVPFLPSRVRGGGLVLTPKQGYRAPMAEWLILLVILWIGLMAVFVLTCLGVGHFFHGQLLGAPSWVWGGAALISAAAALVASSVGRD